MVKKPQLPVFKHRNDAIRNALKGMIPELEGSRLRIDFYCECHRANCRARISLMLAEYEQIHRHAGWFIVRPEHADLELDHVQERRAHYWIIAVLEADK